MAKIVDYNLTEEIAHGIYVSRLAREVARELSMPEEAEEHVAFAGLLHDIGRFEQVRRYGTFVDSVSVDHAALGADLLFREGLLDRFAPCNTVFFFQARVCGYVGCRLPNLSFHWRPECNFLNQYCVPRFPVFLCARLVR